jgi:hypothetical protein
MMMKMVKSKRSSIRERHRNIRRCRRTLERLYLRCKLRLSKSLKMRRRTKREKAVLEKSSGRL